MEEGEALADAQHDQGQVEQDTPERGDVLGPKDGEVGGHELGGESVHLVAGHADGVRRGGDDPDPGQVGDVVILRGAGDGLQARVPTILRPMEHVTVDLVILSVVQKLP